MPNVAALPQAEGGLQPIGRPRMAADEDEVALDRAGGGPAEVVLDPGRGVVFVGPEEADVEPVARELEVIDIAAERGRLGLGSEDEADIGVFLVPIEMVDAALIEGDDIRAQAGGVERFLLDLGEDRPPGGRCLRTRRDGSLNSGGHILDRL